MQSKPFPAPATGSGMQLLSSGCSESETVNLASGNLVCSYSIADIQTIGLPMRLYLTYNHTDNLSGILGTNWRHNYMMNLSIGMTSVTFTSDSGAELGFILSGGSWVADGQSHFLPATLTNPGGSLGPWRITFPDGSFFGFDNSGDLTIMADGHGNQTILSYASGQLVRIAEPTGRAIQFSYSAGKLANVIDPNGNITSFAYTGNNLTSIIAPEGCVTSFTWDSATPNRVVTRTDARGNTHTYTYNGSNKLNTVTDAEGNVLTYNYDTIAEDLGTGSTFGPQDRTKLTDANGNVWEYRFDGFSNLWRAIDPLGHGVHYRWDDQQRLIQINLPFGVNSYGGPFDNPNSSFYRYGYDDSGNRLYEMDPSGMVTWSTYDSNSNLLTTFPGQANLATQGNWVGTYGTLGYVLCAFDVGTGSAPPTDRQNLPYFVSGISPTGSGFTPSNVYPSYITVLNGSAETPSPMDPRAVIAPDSQVRSLGAWGQTSTAMEFEVQLNQVATFNLSIYSSSADQGLVFPQPLTYLEEFGRDLTITVQDLTGTQTYRMYNNAPGQWVTFPVQGDPNTPVIVTVSPSSGSATTDAWISAIAFDPYDNRRTTFTYNSASDLTSVTDGLNHRTTISYIAGYYYDAANYNLASLEAGGQPSHRTDPLGRITRFAYGDSAMNLTQITEPMGNTFAFTYDANGNVLSFQNSNLHTSTYVYDGKNRVINTTNPLGNLKQITYDANGNVSTVEDANNNITQLLYTVSNRLSQIIDANGQSTFMTYDGSGNLTSITDPLGRVTTLAYDTVNRMTQATRPDGNIDTYAYDAQDRLCSIASPNATQTNLPQIITTNGVNLLQNPGAEAVDPNNNLVPQLWNSPDVTIMKRDNTPANAHTGTASFLSIGGGGSSNPWRQAPLALPPGATMFEQHWTNGQTSTTGQSFYDYYDFSGNGNTLNSPTFPFNTGWQQTTPWRFTVPSDMQSGYSATTAGPNTSVTANAFVVTVGVQPHSPLFWMDDFELYILSTAIFYDNESRPIATMAPNGSGKTIWRDRFGRVVRNVDARGRSTQITYDSINRITQVIDPNQNLTAYSYDAVSNLLSFIDAKGNQTLYNYDANNRLLKITYPDNTTEIFTYDAASNLKTYTNNRNQKRTFSYDNAERLISVVYNTDSTQVSFTYDNTGRVLTRTERNNDVTTYTYDALYRVLSEVRTPGIGSSNPSWSHANEWDAAGNRLAYNGDASSSAFTWSIPGTYNAMDLPAFCQDANGRRTGLAYDVESRVNAITFPTESPNTTLNVGYDIVGKVASLSATGSASAHSVAYGYDTAGNRLGMVVGNDTFDYGIDDNGQLIEECVNRFVERRFEQFQTGTANGLSLDPKRETISLLSFNDDFAGKLLNADRWSIGYQSNPLPASGYVGVEVRQSNGLHFAFPRGYSNLIFPFNTSTDVVHDSFGIRNDLEIWAAAANQVQLSGDFDVQVDFSDFQSQLATVTNEAFQTGLAVSDAYYNTNPQNAGVVSILQDVNGQYYGGQIFTGGTSHVTNTSATTATSGAFRIVRSGATLTLYQWTNAWVQVATYGSFITTPVYVSLFFQTLFGTGSICYRDLILNSPSTQYATTGIYTSAVYDAGRTSGLTWDTLSWQASTPPGTQVNYQVAVSTTPTPSSWSFIGPDGTSSTYFSSPSASLPAVLNSPPASNRYIRYQATLIGSGSATPVLYRTDILYGGTTPSQITMYEYDLSASLIDYASYDQDCVDTLNTSWLDSDVVADFDVAMYDVDLFNGTGYGQSSTFGSAPLGQMSTGNLSRIQVENASGITTDVRDAAGFSSSDRVNNLNQILRRDVSEPDSATTTYRYAYDANGNMTSITPSWPITGTLSNGSSTVTSVSASDIASLTVGDGLANAALPAGTTVATIGTTSFTMNHTATATSTGATIVVTSAQTTYSWDEDNRLTMVGLPSGTTVSYTYDMAARMLTKTHSAYGTTTYEWDGMNCMTELAPASTTGIFFGWGVYGTANCDSGVDYGAGSTSTYDSAHCDSTDFYAWNGITNYLIINGMMWGIDFDNAAMTPMMDATGHVRMLVDPNGNVPFTARYEDAYGANVIATDTTPGCHRKFMGTYGVFTDDDIDLLYARHRFLSPSLQRFISREPSHATNPYWYANNDPALLVDDNGLWVQATFTRNGEEYSTLTVVDYWHDANGQIQSHTYVFNNVFSGLRGSQRNNPKCECEKDAGPVPGGKYIIGQMTHVSEYDKRFPVGDLDWFPLLDPSTMRNRQRGYDADGNAEWRNNIWLHPGTVSEGCVTLKSDLEANDQNIHNIPPGNTYGYPTSKDYDTLKNILNHTEPTIVGTVQNAGVGGVIMINTPVYGIGWLTVQ